MGGGGEGGRTSGQSHEGRRPGYMLKLPRARVRLIDILSLEPSKDSEGFIIKDSNTVASIRAYKEDMHGNEAWRNRAAFTKATALFRFRSIFGVAVNTSMVIDCADGFYNIVSVEDVRGRGMYVEVLAEKVSESVAGQWLKPK